MNVAYSIVASGKVQGVWFRYFSRQKAIELGLFGMVENLEDGRVNIWVEGDEKNVILFLEWCHGGPPSAEVVNLEYKSELVKGFESFEINR